MGERRLPVAQGQTLQHLGGVRRGVRLRGVGTLGGQGQGEGRILQRGLQIETGVAATELVAGERRGEDQQRGRIRHLPAEEIGEGDIEPTQPVALGPAGEECVHGLPSGALSLHGLHRPILLMSSPPPTCA
jgi:hypothetical protein